MSGYLTGRRTARFAGTMGLMATTGLISSAMPAGASQLQGLRLAAPVSQVQHAGFRRAVGTAVAVGAVKRHYRNRDKKDKDGDQDTEDGSENDAPARSYGMAQPATPGAPTPETSGAALSDEERAKEVLAAEGSNVVKLHPLQAAAPDYNIVVCEAGCGAQGPRVVYKIAKTHVRSVTLDAKVADGLITKNADCQGGCGDTGKSSLSATATAPSTLSPGVGDWLTAPTAQPPAPSRAQSRSQSTALPQAQPADAPSALAPSAPPKPALSPPALTPAQAALPPTAAIVPPALTQSAAPTPTPADAPDPLASSAPAATDSAPSPDAGKPTATPSREDWLARINRERAAAKPTPTAESPVPPKG